MQKKGRNKITKKKKTDETNKQQTKKYVRYKANHINNTIIVSKHSS